MSKVIGPSFVGIGVQKSATTWLAKMFRLHPEIFLTPAKEIHYFDRNKKYPSPNYWHYDCIMHRFTKKETWWFHVGGILSGVKKLLLHKDFESFIWRIKFHLILKPTDNWYRSLFKTNKKAKGEITPAYSLLYNEDIQRIKDLNREIKIIIILRNPIERAWSFLRWEWQLGHIDIDDHKRINDIINSHSFFKRVDYATSLKNWFKCFSKAQIKIIYFDEIKNDPIRVLRSTFNFLEINALHFDYNNCKDIVAPSNKMEIPAWVENDLKRIFKHSMAELASMLGGYAKTWYDSTFTYL